MSFPSPLDSRQSAPNAGASTPERFERALARRVWHVVAAGDAAWLALYGVLYACQSRWSAVGVVVALAAALAWAWRFEARRGRDLQALQAVAWPHFLVLGAMAGAQGGASAAAGWWLLVPPVALLQAGATRSGLVMATAGVAVLLGPQALPTPSGPMAETPPAALAAAGAAACVLGMVWLGVNWRRKLLRTLDTLRTHAEEATRVKSRFIANMSHEIRTPLNGIVGAAELLRLSGLDAAQAQSARIIDHSAQALLAVVNDILDFSKLEAGRVQIECIGLDPAALAYDTAETFAGQVQSRGVELWAHVTPAVPALIHSDPVRLRQILHNLVSNAMKFTEAGEIRIEVDRRPAADGAPELHFSVRDTGIGLDPAQQARLFQAFSQADISTTRRFGGTGLGLVICRELAQLLGGRLEVRSAPGAGSTFSFILPMPLGEADPAAAPAATNAGRMPGPAVLVCGGRPNLEADLAAWVTALGLHAERAHGAGPDGWLRQAPVAGADTLLVDDEALQAGGLSRGTWAARLRAQGLHGVLLMGVAVPVVAVPEGLVPVYKPARPIRIEGALREARRGASSWRDALLGPRRNGGQPADADPAQIGDAGAPPTAVPSHPSHDEHLGRDPGPSIAAGLLRSPPVLFKPIQPAQPTQATVLLAEDNPVNQAVARALLAQLRVRADVAADGAAALEMLEDAAAGYAAVLMDCQMPVLDGYAATRAWRRRESELGRSRLPVIAMTANSVSDVGAACTEAGMDDFVSKPFTIGELKRVLDRWLPPTRAAA